MYIPKRSKALLAGAGLCTGVGIFSVIEGAAVLFRCTGIDLLSGKGFPNPKIKHLVFVW